MSTKITFSSFIEANPHGSLLALLYDPSVNADNIDRITESGEKAFLTLVKARLKAEGKSLSSEDIDREYRPLGRKNFCSQFKKAIENDQKMTRKEILATNYIQEFIKHADLSSLDISRKVVPDALQNFKKAVEDLDQLLEGRPLKKYTDFAAHLLTVYQTKKQLKEREKVLSSLTEVQKQLRLDLGARLFNAFHQKKLQEEDFNVIVTLLKMSLDISQEGLSDFKHLPAFQNSAIFHQNRPEEEKILMQTLVLKYVEFFATFENKEPVKNTIDSIDISLRGQLHFKTEPKK